MTDELIITTANGKVRKVSGRDFAKAATSAGKKSPAGKEARVLASRKALRALLADARKGKALSAKWERKLRHHARMVGRNDEQSDALVQRATANAPIDPRRR